MTHRRPPASVEAAILEAINRLTPAEIEAATGKGIAFFYKVANPEHRQQLSFKDAAAIDRALAKNGLPRLLGPLFRMLSETDQEQHPPRDKVTREVTRLLGLLIETQDEEDDDAEARAWEAILIAVRQGHSAACARVAKRPGLSVVPKRAAE